MECRISTLYFHNPRIRVVGQIEGKKIFLPQNLTTARAEQLLSESLVKLSLLHLATDARAETPRAAFKSAKRGPFEHWAVTARRSSQWIEYVTISTTWNGCGISTIWRDIFHSLGVVSRLIAPSFILSSPPRCNLFSITHELLFALFFFYYIATVQTITKKKINGKKLKKIHVRKNNINYWRRYMKNVPGFSRNLALSSRGIIEIL